jgi:hypothetical protein
MGAALVLSTLALLSLAFVIPHVGLIVKLSVIGSLLGLAVLAGAVYAVHTVLFAALLLIPGPVFPLFQVWPFSLLGPLILYGAAVLAIPPLLLSVGWVRRGTIDTKATIY